MAWEATSIVDQRKEVWELHSQGHSVAALARMYKVSRQTIYNTVARMRRLGTMEPQSKARARKSPWKTPANIEAAIVEARQKHGYGAKKIRAILVRERPEVAWPSVWTMTQMFRRNGLLEPKKRQPKIYTPTGLLTRATAPNDVWCVDYKGQFRVGDSTLCYPLTVTDLYSRKILAIRLMPKINMQECITVFAELFGAYGVPRYIRSDNGAPFASSGSPLALTRLSAYWLQQGAYPEHTDPGHPEQNGSHERMHRTYKWEACRIPENSLLQQQDRSDQWLKKFNGFRPHEALGQKTPNEMYGKPPKRTVAAPTYPIASMVRVVDIEGRVTLPGNFVIYVSKAVATYPVGITQIADNRYVIDFAGVRLGAFAAFRKKTPLPYELMVSGLAKGPDSSINMSSM